MTVARARAASRTPCSRLSEPVIVRPQGYRSAHTCKRIRFDLAESLARSFNFTWAVGPIKQTSPAGNATSGGGGHVRQARGAYS